MKTFSYLSTEVLNVSGAGACHLDTLRSYGDEREILNRIEEILNSSLQRVEVVLDNRKDSLCVNLKIAMRNAVSSSNDIPPRNLWTLGKKLTIRMLIYLLDALSNGLDEHAVGGKFLHPSGR